MSLIVAIVRSGARKVETENSWNLPQTNIVS